MKIKSAIWISLILTVIGAMVYYLMKQNALTVNPGTTPGNDSGNTQPGEGADSLFEIDKMPVSEFPLRAGIPYGTYSRQVAYMQLYLNKNYSKNLSVDGKYGPLTKAAALSIFGLSEFTQSLYASIIEPKESELRDYMQRR